MVGVLSEKYQTGGWKATRSGGRGWPGTASLCAQNPCCGGSGAAGVGAAGARAPWLGQPSINTARAAAVCFVSERTGPSQHTQVYRRGRRGSWESSLLFCCLILGNIMTLSNLQCPLQWTKKGSYVESMPWKWNKNIKSVVHLTQCFTCDKLSVSCGWCYTNRISYFSVLLSQCNGSDWA